MTRIECTTEIRAPAAKIWEKLTDFASYPEWNPLVPKVTGKAGAGEKLKIALSTLTIDMSLDIDVEITEFEKEKNLTWVGTFPFMGFLLKGEHYFILQEKSETETKFVHGEKFTGILEPLLSPVLNSQLPGLYEKLNIALKNLMEAR